MANVSQAMGQVSEIPPHPFLEEPILYVSNLPAHITDEVIARTLEFCVPFRPRLIRDPATGTATGSIEFRTIERAEKALATLNGRVMIHAYPQVILHLDPLPPTSPPANWPPPNATPRVVSSLPPSFSDSKLFDTFRGFGAIASCRMQGELGPDVGVVTFWREEDAARGEEVMHMSEIEDYNISVKVLLRKPEFNPAAPSFVPSGGYPMRHPASPPLQSFSLSPMPSPHLSLGGNHSPMMMPGQPLPVMYSPPRLPMQFPRSPTMAPFVHGPGQQVQYAPSTGPGSTSASGLIDPCNLFCKNLDPEIDSKTLHAQFRRFGHIVSARIMRNEQGQSRGFGFVSFQTPEEATRALGAMNGATVGNKQIVVRLHEPKQLRKEKLAQRFAQGGHNGHPRSGSGATSPTLSEAGDSVAGWSSPGRHDRHRRGSGSYYQAALQGTLHMPMQFDELSGLSPVVRHEVLTGELIRRLRSFPEVKPEEIDSIVEHLMSQSLDTICAGLASSQVLLTQIKAAKESLGLVQPPPDVGPSRTELYSTPSISRTASINSTLLDPNTLAATASAPEHPSTPVSFTPSMNTPPRTASPTGSIAPGTEKERLMVVVTALEPSRAADITEMLLSLSKKERAMCLFSTEYLRVKVDTAKGILDTLAEEDESAPVAEMSKLSVAAPSPAPAPTTPQPQHRRPEAMTAITPQTPELSSSNGPSTTTSPADPPTPAVTSVHTLATLAKLPAVEIVKLASSPQSTGLPLPKADPLIVKSTDEFVDGLLAKPLAAQKQLLGEKLFKTIRAFGIKNSPKITINLLDTEDLRALAHLMNSYPSVLKEKVLLQIGATKK